MTDQFQSIFVRLRAVLQRHAGNLTAEDSPNRYCLEGSVGPATLRAWGGKARKATIPVAWVQIGKASVSFHLMGIHGNDRLLGTISSKLRARMQGKTCFNFKTLDEALFKELERVTSNAIAAFRKAGFVAD